MRGTDDGYAPGEYFDEVVAQHEALQDYIEEEVIDEKVEAKIPEITLPLKDDAYDAVEVREELLTQKVINDELLHEDLVRDEEIKEAIAIQDIIQEEEIKEKLDEEYAEDYLREQQLRHQ